MKVFAKEINESQTRRREIGHDLGIVIIHDNKEYHINVDNNGHLYLQSSESALVIKPRASNSILLEQE